VSVLLDSVDLGINYSDVSALIMVIGGMLAIIGATVIYKKFSGGKHNIEEDIFLWGGGILLLIIIQVFVSVLFSGSV